METKNCTTICKANKQIIVRFAFCLYLLTVQGSASFLCWQPIHFGSQTHTYTACECTRLASKELSPHHVGQEYFTTLSTQTTASVLHHTCLAARRGAAAPTSANIAVSPPAPFHMASPDSCCFGKTPRTFSKTLFEGCRRFPPAAHSTRSPLMLSIVSAPTCLKFLRDPDILQWYFNNSLIIVPDNNLHCMETSCAGLGGRGCLGNQEKIIRQRDTRGHELICSLPAQKSIGNGELARK